MGTHNICRARFNHVGGSFFGLELHNGFVFDVGLSMDNGGPRCSQTLHAQALSAPPFRIMQSNENIPGDVIQHFFRSRQGIEPVDGGCDSH